MSANIEDLRKELEKRSTDDLISILRNRDEEEWRPEVFALVSSLLEARGLSPKVVMAMGPEGSDVVESEPMVTVARFTSPTDGQLVRMALEEADIAAWVTDEAGGTMYGIGIGTRLQVRLKDADAALGVLSSAPASAEGLPADLAEPPCPACGSRNVSSEARVAEPDPHRARWRQTRRRWYYACEDCHEAWPARDDEEEGPAG